MSVAPDWSERELKLLRENPDLTVEQAQRMLDFIGFKRTIAAVNKQRVKLQVTHPRGEKWSEARKAGRRAGSAKAAEAQRGWPKTPRPEDADHIFVRTVVLAMRAEGLIRGIAA